jgi:hypothetical protein
MKVFTIQIRSQETTIWRSPAAMETRVFAEAMQVADRMAQACRKTANASYGATRTWVVEIIGEAGGTFYRAPVAWA